MGLKSRTKGASGERELAALVHELTGWNVRRRVRQHEGDSDLEGVPGWSIEVKRHATATRSDIRVWYEQAQKQSAPERLCPVLFYRRDRDEWRAVWPLAVTFHVLRTDVWERYCDLDSSYDWTCEGSVQAWAAVARETQQ